MPDAWVGGGRLWQDPRMLLRLARLGLSTCLCLATAGCTGTSSGDAEASSSEASEAGESSESESGTESETGSSDLPAPLPERIAVTADFSAHSVSILDAEALLALEGSDADIADVLVRSVDLSEFAAGPLELEFVPGTREVVIAMGPGFFGGIVGGLISAGDVDQSGMLVHLDLESGEILGTLDREVPPMGLAFADDGQTLMVADYGNETVRGDTVSFIDMASFTQSGQLVVGAGPEQLHVNPSQDLAIVNAAGPGTVRVFDPGDPDNSLSAPLVVSGDPSWVHFIGEGPLAVVTNSTELSNWAVVDFSDPSTPSVREQGEVISGFPYALAALDADTFIFTSMTVNRFEWHEVDVSTAPSTLVATHSFEGKTVFPLGIALDADSRRLLAPMAGDDALGVFDLDADSFVRVAWAGAPGPTYIVLEP